MKQLSSVTTVDSRGQSIKKVYKHPYDYSGSPYTQMRNLNQINPVIEEIDYVGSQETHRFITEYMELNSFNAGKYLYRPSFFKESYQANALYTKVGFSQYNKLGQVAETTDAMGIKTSYIWGYGGQYLIAKIENGAIADITRISGLSDLLNNPLSEALSTAQENALRNLSGSLVTTYTYDPLVGMTSMTDPSGRKVSYKYDSFNRLTQVLDLNETVTEEYDYHYKSN
jgi:YD repeat-containing protein